MTTGLLPAYPFESCDDGQGNTVKATSHVIADYIFGKVFACGGSNAAEPATCISDKCYFLDCIAKDWVETYSIRMPEKITNQAAVVVKKAGEEMYWWATGGLKGET